jgi:hypothetical protein
MKSLETESCNRAHAFLYYLSCLFQRIRMRMEWKARSDVLVMCLLHSIKRSQGNSLVLSYSFVHTSLLKLSVASFVYFGKKGEASE